MILVNRSNGSGVGGVDSRNQGEIVLEFVEVGFGGCESVVKGIDKIWIERTEGKLVHVVGKVER